MSLGSAREGPAKRGPEDWGEQAQRRAALLYGAHFFCPEGGRYRLSADGKECSCSVHGSARSPGQPEVPAEGGPLDRLLGSFGGASATLSFLEDGLHAVLIVERK